MPASGIVGKIRYHQQVARYQTRQRLPRRVSVAQLRLPRAAPLFTYQQDRMVMAAAATGEEWALWLRLAQTPRVGSGAARTLLSAFGLPGNIFAASLGQLRQHVPDETAQALRAPPSGELSLLCEQTAAWLAQSGNHILTLADAAYPVALLSIPDPPIMLYVKGQVALLSAPSFAIVGSRRA
ncbi:MAG: DNA-processing protein DprA, partial [Burkholderiaceae bacterium]|nr:DNA-processing protein DprA [Burkholderiaceae bacterium]